MRRRTVLLFLTLILGSVLPMSAWAACGWPPNPDVEFPEDGVVLITLYGTWCNSCSPTIWRSTIVGDEIRVDLAHSSGICLPAARDWSSTVVIENVPEGRYRLVARLYASTAPGDPPTLEEGPDFLAEFHTPGRFRIDRAQRSGGISLRWTGLGPSYRYTVETSGVPGSDAEWSPADPPGQWPVDGTEWTGPAPETGRIFYRVRAEYVPTFRE